MLKNQEPQKSGYLKPAFYSFFSFQILLIGVSYLWRCQAGDVSLPSNFDFLERENDYLFKTSFFLSLVAMIVSLIIPRFTNSEKRPMFQWILLDIAGVCAFVVTLFTSDIGIGICLQLMTVFLLFLMRPKR